MAARAAHAAAPARATAGRSWVSIDGHDLPHRIAAPAPGRLPVDDSQKNAGDRSPDRLRQRGVVFEGIQPAVRAAARRVPSRAPGSSAADTPLARPSRWHPAAALLDL